MNSLHLQTSNATKVLLSTLAHPTVLERVSGPAALDKVLAASISSMCKKNEQKPTILF